MSEYYCEPCDGIHTDVCPTVELAETGLFQVETDK